MNLDTLQKLTGQLISELTFWVNRAKALEEKAQEITKQYADFSVKETELAEKHKKLDKTQQIVNEQKAYNKKISDTFEKRELVIHQDEILIKNRKEDLDKKWGEYNEAKKVQDEREKKLVGQEDREDDLKKREIIMEKEKEIDRERKKTLDLRENRIKTREKQLQLDAET